MVLDGVLWNSLVQLWPMKMSVQDHSARQHEGHADDRQSERFYTNWQLHNLRGTFVPATNVVPVGDFHPSSTEAAIKKTTLPNNNSISIRQNIRRVNQCTIEKANHVTCIINRSCGGIVKYEC